MKRAELENIIILRRNGKDVVMVYKLQIQGDVTQ